MPDLLIIGGGPAGLAAAAYRLGKHLDEDKSIGT
jgi:thioredoxin reductase